MWSWGKPCGSELWHCRGWGVSMQRLFHLTAARLAGSGMKSLSPFPADLDGLTSLPSISTRTVPLPSLGSRVRGGQGFTFPPPPFLDST